MWTILNTHLRLHRKWFQANPKQEVEQKPKTSLEFVIGEIFAFLFYSSWGYFVKSACVSGYLKDLKTYEN